ncbi:Flp pilus assembly protein CpaB [Microaerobacter geothermalis]|uniref:Flp pilus assembly protein CpaB n=1 Tax=Microaerobacter geothermalis TaxID=674972 RepID=UPI001F45DCF1|nr:Flp pilus assembly protein CpaB [Microaerobacter geothermalis]MCF6094503.1 Flp pilus assembly protein CpaB [Microaerobacter geothermalis]
MKISKFTKRKIIAVIVALLVVGGIYQYNSLTLEEEMNPVTVVIARQDIPPHTEITESMLFQKLVPASTVPPNSIIDPDEIIGKWTVEGYGIAKNSYFYEGKILTKDEMPDAAVLKLEKNEKAFSLLVDLETSSGNSIIPGAYVDLYFATTQTESKKPLVGRMFKRIRVTSVKDSKTQDVFSPQEYTESKKKDPSKVATSTNNPKALAKLYTLAVTEEQLDYLNKAKMLGNIIPVATGTSFLKIEDQDNLEKQQAEKADNNSADEGTDELDQLESLTPEQFILKWIEENSYTLETFLEELKKENQQIKE